jgi:hypothetical protein
LYSLQLAYYIHEIVEPVSMREYGSVQAQGNDLC